MKTSLLDTHFSVHKTLLREKEWKYALDFSLPLNPHYLSKLVLSQSDNLTRRSYVAIYMARI